MNKGVTTTLPSNNGYPGLTIAWSKDCRPAFHEGIRAAERWLNGKRSHWLWAALIFERDALQDETDRKAFEVAFMSRIQQRFEGTS
nr:LasR-specific antiactivator QslA [uncultured Pseudomonas sp.]